MSRAVMAVQRVSKRYASGPQEEGSWAVNGVSLSVFAGDVTILMGPSGSGKTTLLTLLGGLLAPTRGTLSVCGVRLDTCSEPERQRFRREKIGFVFQNCNLLESMSASQNVAIGLATRGDDPGRSGELLRQVGLGDKGHALPNELSGGQRQRVGIARALAGNPPVLLADEPTAALDAYQGRRVMELMRQRAKDCGTTVLVVTHDPRVREFADRVIEMEDGCVKRIVRRVRPAQAVDNPWLVSRNSA